MLCVTDSYIITDGVGHCRKVGLAGTDRTLEKPPFPITRNFPLRLPWRETAAAFRRHSNVRVPGTAGLRGSESLAAVHIAPQSEGLLPPKLGLEASLTNFSSQELWPTSSHPQRVILLSVKFLSILLPLFCHVTIYPAFSQTLSVNPQGAREALVIIIPLLQIRKLRFRAARDHTRQ